MNRLIDSPASGFLYMSRNRRVDTQGIGTYPELLPRLN